MDDSFSRLYGIYHSALELPESRRQQFLEEECGNDREIIEEVNRLLSSAERASSEALGTPANLLSLSGSWAMESHEDACKPGQRIGVYEIERVIGQGGSGTVALATRQNQFSQRVAIKMLRPELVSNQVFVRRFDLERQLLSDLQHENIAGLFDGGCTDSGQPYLVMEYVDGVRITEYCEKNSLTIAERLRVFQTVCHAVSHAHRFGVIHRDIKPSNIMVNSDGVPKLVDFGIAKLVDKPQDDRFQTVTVDGELPMTPEYASPEQLKNEPIGTASDIYSLGIVLYEVLTGARPFDFSSRSLHEVVRVVCDEEPASPSSALVAGNGLSSNNNQVRLASELKGDLDHIVLKAIRKEPDSRYSSVDEFAQDIDRYFAGLPLSARRGTFRYKAAKFLRRNAAIVSLGSVLMISLLVGFIGMSILVARLIDERNQRQAAMIVEYLSDASRHTAQRNIDGGLRNLARAISLMPDSESGFDVRYLLNQSTKTFLDVPFYYNAGERFISSPYNQQYLATATIGSDRSDAGIRLWNPASNWQLSFQPEKTLFKTQFPYYRLSHFSPPIAAVACDLTTNRIAYFREDQTTLVVADLDSGETVDTYSTVDESGERMPGLITFSADGKSLATLDTAGQILVFDASERKLIRKGVLQLTMKGGFGLRFSPDGNYLAAVSERGQVKVWNRNLESVFDKTLENDTPFSLCWTHDSRRLVVGTRLQKLFQWDTSDANLVEKASLTFPATALTFSTDDNLLAVGGKAVQIFALETWKPIENHTCPTEIVDLRFSRNNSTLISTDRIGAARIWSVPNQKSVSPSNRIGRTSRAGPPPMENIVVPGGLKFAAMHPNENLFAFERDNTIQIFHREDAHEIGAPIELNCTTIWKVSFSRDGKFMSASHMGGNPGGIRVSILDFETRQVVKEITGGREFTFSRTSDRFAMRYGNELLLGNNADLLLSGGREDLKVETRIVGKQSIQKFAVADNKPLVATADGSNTSVEVWYLDNKVPRRYFSVDVSGKVRRRERIFCEFSPDATRLAISYARTLDLWDVEKRKRIVIDHAAFSSATRKPIFSPDSKLLVALGSNRIWFRDGKSGSKRSTLEISEMPIGMFSGDGNSLIVGMKSVRIFNAMSPDEFSRTLPIVREHLRQVDLMR